MASAIMGRLAQQAGRGHPPISFWLQLQHGSLPRSWRDLTLPLSYRPPQSVIAPRSYPTHSSMAVSGSGGGHEAYCRWSKARWLSKNGKSPSADFGSALGNGDMASPLGD